MGLWRVPGHAGGGRWCLRLSPALPYRNREFGTSPLHPAAIWVCPLVPHQEGCGQDMKATQCPHGSQCQQCPSPPGSSPNPWRTPCPPQASAHPQPGCRSGEEQRCGGRSQKQRPQKSLISTPLSTDPGCHHPRVGQVVPAVTPGWVVASPWGGTAGSGTGRGGS